MMATSPSKQRIYANTPNTTKFPSWVTKILNNLHLTGHDRVTEGNQLLAANSAGAYRGSPVRPRNMIGGSGAANSSPTAPRPGRTTTQSSFSLTSLWIQAGGSAALAPVMAAIALAESGGRVSAIGGPNNNGTYDYGLWQINSSHSSYNKADLTSDPLYNARAAVAIEKSQGLTAWSTYTSGAYEKYVGQNATVQASNGANSNASATGRVRPGGDTGSGAGSGGGGDITQVLSDWSNSQSAAGADTQGGTVDPSGNSDVSLITGLNPFKGPFGIPLLPNPLDFFKNVSGSVNSVVDFLKLLAWIINPVNILRAVEFLVGLALMTFGFQAMLQAYGERKEGFSTSENPISRSGLGRISRELVSATPQARAAKATYAKRRIRPQAAPHRTRRQALRLRYDREKQVSQRRAIARRQGA